jgi:hypothetical protein
VTEFEAAMELVHALNSVVDANGDDAFEASVEGQEIRVRTANQSWVLGLHAFSEKP